MVVHRQRTRWRSRVASGECSMNAVVPAIDEWAARCQRQSRELAARRRCAARVGSSFGDPCRGANEGREVEYGSLSLLFTGPGRRCPSWPPACKSTDAKKTNIAGPRFRPARAPLSQSKISGGQHEKPRRRTRTLLFCHTGRERVRLTSRRYAARAGRIFALRATGCRARAL